MPIPERSNEDMKGAVGFISGIGTFSLSKWKESRVWLFHGVQPLEVGESVRVRTMLSPLAGQTGRIVDKTPGDAYGPYLVRFDSGFQFRYRRNELALTIIPDSAREDR
jgi:hypothetical protein